MERGLLREPPTFAMKIFVKTRGEFMLICPYTRQTVESGRPYVIKPTDFFNDRIARGQLEVVGKSLPDEANDADFAKWWQESPETAVEGYPTTFEVAEEKPAPAPKPRRGRKG